MKIKNVLLVIILTTFLSSMAQPPDPPLTPQQWIDKMDVGHWWIFQIPPAANNNITVNYSERILDSLQTNFCINGGRLHWVIESPHYSSYDANGEIPQSILDEVHSIIDDFMERDMAICLNIQFTNPDLIKPGMSQALRNRMKNAWVRVSEELKDVSHNLAMSPVIEFHGWQNLGNPVRQDSLNVLYHELTTIFRQHNPTRIMSYKPWGSAKRAEFNTLDYPFGNDPLPGSGQPFYYVSSFSGSAGLGDWDTWSPNMSQQDLDALHFQTINAGSSDPANVWGIRAAIEHRNNTAIPFWMDHWRPNYHKNYGTPEQWTMEQNIAYTEFFINKLREIGSGGAFFQTRTFWNENTNDLIRLTPNSPDTDVMSVMFMDQLHDMCEASLEISENETQQDIIIYPNPVDNTLQIKYSNIKPSNIYLYSIKGKDLTKILSYDDKDNTLKISTKDLSKGVYFLKINNITKKIIKK